MGKARPKHGPLREVVGQPRRKRKHHLYSSRYLEQGVAFSDLQLSLGWIVDDEKEKGREWSLVPPTTAIESSIR